MDEYLYAREMYVCVCVARGVEVPFAKASVMSLIVHIGASMSRTTGEVGITNENWT